MSNLDLRLIVITDARQAAPRSIFDIVQECLDAGAPAIQLRDKDASGAQLLEQALRLREMTERYNALLFINDRLDVALASHADGVHLGPDDVPVKAAKQFAPTLIIGVSADVALIARNRVLEGAGYVGCGAVFRTASKAEVADEAIGLFGLARVVREVTVPVVGIGGITIANVADVAAAGAAGCAVIGAIMTARKPGIVTRQLLNAF